MKQFILFGGDQYYPRGGWSDFMGHFDTLNEAVGVALEANEDWWHVLDTETMSKVAEDWQYWEALEDYAAPYNDAEREEH